MLNSHRAIALALAAAVLTPSAVSAYKMNPYRDRDTGGQMPLFGGSIEPVHEDITHTAAACAYDLRLQIYLDLAGPAILCNREVRERARGDPGNIRYPLIVGVWWNDDPHHQLYVKNGFAYLLQDARAERSADKVRRSGGLHQDRVTRGLYYRSHFGDLQFLHAMAGADGESPQVTRQRIIDWMDFAYRIATGKIAPQARLAELEHPIAPLFANHAATAEALFKPRARMAHLPLDELALGSMLHLVQDSFAAGHAARVATRSPRCARGRVTQFRSYLSEDEDLHGAEDVRRALYRDMSGRRDGAEARFNDWLNPVETSARIILMVRRHVDWHTVLEPYLRSTLFCLDQDALPAGPGEFSLWRAAPPRQGDTVHR